MSFQAKFGGRCANECGSPIEVGDLIMYDAEDDIIHVGCETRPEAPPDVCERCNIMKPCWCDA